LPLTRWFARAVFDRTRGIERGLPTQTDRPERQVDFQQFSTPLALSWLVALAGAPQSDDIVLEPCR